MLAELGRRLGHELADTSSGQTTDDTMLSGVTARARCSFDELVEKGWAEAGHDLPAPWVERHVERLGGWRLAPGSLVEQLAALRTTAPLVLGPRRQKRHRNSQLTYLGDAAEVLVHPGDAATAGVVDAQAPIVRGARGKLVGIAKVEPSIRRGAVSVPHGHQGANVNQLTSKDDIDVVTGTARYSGIPVSVHPAPGDWSRRAAWPGRPPRLGETPW